MIRVTDLERSIKFYRDGLGFQVVSRNEYPDEKFTLVFMRSAEDGGVSGKDGPAIELTHNWETHRYDRGDAYGHVAYSVKSVEEVQSRLRSHGYDLSWGPGKTPNGKRVMAFVDDPDGFEIELLEG